MVQRAIICFLILVSAATLFSGDIENQWPTWRGPLFTGEAPAGSPPLEWSETQNVKWKVPIPGKGLSSPVVWDGQIFITSAVGIDKAVDPEVLEKLQGETPEWLEGRSHKVDKIQQFYVYSIDLENGKVLWKKMLNESLPHEGTHQDGSWASNSCVTDGKKLVAFFGSYGIYCLDLKGKLLWEKDLGDMYTSNQFGGGSSPALYDDTVVVNWDHEGDSFIVVLSATTGKELWRKERDERTSWATPLITKVNGKAQIIINATTASRGYDLRTGDIVWELAGMTRNTIPSPLLLDGTVFLMSGFRGNKLQAIKLDKASGNLENSEAVLWSSDEKITPYVPSALLYKGKLYIPFSNRAQLTCLDAKSGTAFYSKEKIEGLKGVYAAPVAADGKVYISGRKGSFAVVKAGPQFELLQVNKLDDSFDASPAIIGKNLILRGFSSLYCISAD